MLTYPRFRPVHLMHGCCSQLLVMAFILMGPLLFLYTLPGKAQYQILRQVLYLLELLLAEGAAQLHPLLAEILVGAAAVEGPRLMVLLAALAASSLNTSSPKGAKT